jgi:hypothetical protein
MRLKEFLAAVIVMLLLPVAVSAQDFASRFKGEHPQDSNLVYVTISPKMMQEVLENDENKDENLLNIISDLKSMQVCNSKVNARDYYDDALSLAEKQGSMFETVAEINKKDCLSKVVVRRKRNTVIELVSLIWHSERGFVLINFTGKIDEKIIAKLSGDARGKGSDKQ